MSQQMGTPFRKCSECGYDGRYAFYNPKYIYCEGCDRLVGMTDEEVHSDMAALSGNAVVHANDSEVLATVTWFRGKTEP